MKHSTPIPFANGIYAGRKHYELTNHLGNVQATVTDRLILEDTSQTGYVTNFRAHVSGAQDYFPFGMIMPGRSYNAAEYRFGFNSVEKDDEITGSKGSHYEFRFREYDSRLGRFWSVDPLASKYPWNSTYAFAENRIIDGIDLEGLEWFPATAKFLMGNDAYQSYVKGEADGFKSYYEDAKTLITGTDCNGFPSSRFTAGLFLLLDFTPAKVLKPVIKISKGGLRLSYKTAKAAFDFISIEKTYSKGVEELVAVTGKINNGKEIITITKSGSYTDAQKVVGDVLGSSDDVNVPWYGDYKHNRDVVVGYKNKAGTKGFRIDFDPKKGGEINWYNNESRESGAVLHNLWENSVQLIQGLQTHRAK